MAGKLFVVGTPIGNLSDFSPRAVATLSECDFIAAEDTRVTLKLLNHFEIKTPMISYYEHNKRSKGDIIIKRILDGESCAIVTDAGMPAISDPGEDLVALAHQNGITVESVPGPTAFATAMAISGMPSGRFTFEGFLSVNKPSRREHLEEVKNERRTMIFYEAPHKLLNTLKDFKEYFGADRSLTIARELTKLHEQIWLTTVGEALDFYTENSPKGEFVLIVAGGVFETAEKELTLDDIAQKCIEIMESENLPLKEAAKLACAKTAFSKSEVYKAAQNLRG